MTKLIGTLTATLVFSSSTLYAQTQRALPRLSPLAAPIAAVYTGPGSCEDNCSGAAAAVAEEMGFEIRYIAHDEVATADLSDVTLWLQPGGNAIDASHALKAAGLAKIRKFVADGGAYVGFCAGAFLADKWVDDDDKVKGLAILPREMETIDYPVDSNNRLGVMLWLYTGDQKQHVYFNGGGSYYIPQNNKGKMVNIVSTYGLHGLPATIQVRYGNGNVVISGAHPEAFEQWKVDGDLIDLDGSDWDYAKSMIEMALN